jgi:hypothetical protein
MKFWVMLQGQIAASGKSKSKAELYAACKDYPSLLRDSTFPELVVKLAGGLAGCSSDNSLVARSDPAGTRRRVLKKGTVDSRQIGNNKQQGPRLAAVPAATKLAAASVSASFNLSRDPAKGSAPANVSVRLSNCWKWTWQQGVACSRRTCSW